MGKTKISYARQCAIIPAKDGKMGYSEDVIIVETSTIEDGQEIIEKQIFNRQNERIGIIDKDGNIQFVEEYKQKLQESLGKERYEQLGIDKRQIALDELLENNEFEELIPGEEIEGLSNKEVEEIIEEHANIQEEQTEQEQMDEETLKVEVSKSLGVDENQIVQVKVITDKMAISILNNQDSIGYPIMLTMSDGSIQFVNKENDGYKPVHGVRETDKNENMTTNFIDINGNIIEANLQGRFYDPSKPNRAIGIIMDESGEYKPVAENISLDQLGNKCSISRTLATNQNQSITINANVEELVENASGKQVETICYELDSKRGEKGETNRININDCTSVSDEYKKGEVSDTLNANLIAEEVLKSGEDLSRDEIVAGVYKCIDASLPEIGPEERAKLAEEAIAIVSDECMLELDNGERNGPLAHP